jgi:three-Cys-motif partner protein
MSRFGSEGEDIIGPWSEEKLELLTKYLKAYSVIMNEQRKSWLRSYYYIDAFAGSVKPQAQAKDQDEKRYIDGSPIKALQTEPRFNGYWFIDMDPRRIERVKELKVQFPDSAIDIYQGNCNEILLNDVIPRLANSLQTRAFVFLDPYGLQVNWETVAELANTGICDIFVNFSVMGVTRLLPKDRKPGPEVIDQLNNVMGSTDWINQIYREPTTQQLDLFGNQQESSLSRETIPAEWLASLYTSHLSSLFPHVSKSILMRNSTNSALYALCLASHNSAATKITNDIFKRHERLRQL